MVSGGMTVSGSMSSGQAGLQVVPPTAASPNPGHLRLFRSISCSLPCLLHELWAANICRWRAAFATYFTSRIRMGRRPRRKAAMPKGSMGADEGFRS
jgi:hypothetical protein